MPVSENTANLPRGHPYTTDIDLSASRAFDKSSEPDLPIKANTFIIIRNDIDDVKVAFNYGMMDAPLRIDKHQDDNLIIYRGEMDGVWLAHDAGASGNIMRVLYGNDIFLDHSHKNIYIQQDYFERNGSTDRVNYDADGIAPHAATTRAAYTCPAGKTARINGSLSVTRKTAPTAAAFTRISVRIAAGVVAEASIHYNNTVGAHDNQPIPETFLDAGDSILIETIDLSTGGDVNYMGALVIREFDAA